MKRADLIASGVLPGVVGGVAGGIVFGAAMLDLGVLSSVASIVRVESAVVGFIVHMAIAATVGAGLGVLVWHQRPGTGETLLWGLAYGTLWWFIGTLTLHPLLLGNTLAWDAESARAALPALLGHVLFGASAGLVISLVRLRYRGGEDSMLITASALIRGGTAGLVAVWIIGTVLAAQGQLHSFVAVTPQDSGLTVWLTTLLVGLLAGVGFAILYPSAADSAGVGLVRGGLYGFLWWVAVPLSVLPALHGSGLPWQVDQVRAVFPTLPGCILFGAATALLYHWLGVVTRVLFSDIGAGADSEGVGTQGLRAVGGGLLSGFVGGLVFTGVMVQIGAFASVASLLRVESSVTGFFVHLIIANIVGASYGLLFRRQSLDMGSALGWGVSYGFIWWFIGSLTLFPALLGATPQWTADAAATAFPHLIGHLIFGASLGVTFYLLEARYRPWWIPRDQAQARRVASRREQLLTSAPALWTLIVIISLTLPVVLGSSGPSLPGVSY